MQIGHFMEKRWRKGALRRQTPSFANVYWSNKITALIVKCMLLAWKSQKKVDRPNVWLPLKLLTFLILIPTHVATHLLRFWANKIKKKNKSCCFGHFMWFQNHIKMWHKTSRNEICFPHSQCVVSKRHVGLYVESKLQDVEPELLLQLLVCGFNIWLSSIGPDS